MQHQPDFHSSVYDLMSDWLGVSIAGPLDLVCLARHGVSVDALDVLHQLGCLKADIAWIIPASTLKRRKTDNALLTAAESGRLLQWLRLRAATEVVFGDADTAKRWMTQPIAAFQGLSATDVMKTGVGTALVDNVLLQIDSGYVA